MSININYQKYIKYKNKYLILKAQIAGNPGTTVNKTDSPRIKEFKEQAEKFAKSTISDKLLRFRKRPIPTQLNQLELEYSTKLAELFEHPICSLFEYPIFKNNR